MEPPANMPDASSRWHRSRTHHYLLTGVSEAPPVIEPLDRDQHEAERTFG